MMSCLKPITANKNTLEMVQYGVEGSTAFLECQARSPHVSIKWHLQKENSDRKKEVGRSPPWPLSQVMSHMFYAECAIFAFSKGELKWMILGGA